jgi:hypothetical protein
MGALFLGERRLSPCCCGDGLQRLNSHPAQLNLPNSFVLFFSLLQYIPTNRGRIFCQAEAVHARPAEWFHLDLLLQRCTAKTCHRFLNCVSLDAGSITSLDVSG